MGTPLMNMVGFRFAFRRRPRRLAMLAAGPADVVAGKLEIESPVEAAGGGGGALFEAITSRKTVLNYEQHEAITVLCQG